MTLAEHAPIAECQHTTKSDVTFPYAFLKPALWAELFCIVSPDEWVDIDAISNRHRDELPGLQAKEE